MDEIPVRGGALERHEVAAVRIAAPLMPQPSPGSLWRKSPRAMFDRSNMRTNRRCLAGGKLADGLGKLIQCWWPSGAAR